MRKKYNVLVNGQTYEVVVEEVQDAASAPAFSPPTVPQTPSTEVRTAAPAAPKASTPVAVGAPPAGTSIDAPMPGTILRLNVRVGDNVKIGDIVLILEAMKMENQISTPIAGVVTAINAPAGSNVNTGDPMITIG